MIRDHDSVAKESRHQQSDGSTGETGKDNPLVGQGIKPAFQIGTLPANAIRASRIKRLHKQAVYKTANLR